MKASATLLASARVTHLPAVQRGPIDPRGLRGSSFARQTFFSPLSPMRRRAGCSQMSESE